ncbi:glycosyltransferase family 2 protein [Kaistella solincola]|uniref:glycosyltransferase family 2 protein n=1 Tax=Kaistella solincola TaxID=510955 RepID=UPI00068BF6C7|nr:glycosyltransferase [Kaistella solincola]
MKDALVTIIVITYNSEKYVLETLESARDQTYQNIELVIADDGSTDNTIEICRKWLLDNKQRFLGSKIVTTPVNTGISANCNRGLQASSGDWIKFIAGDDMLRTHCIRTYIDYIAAHSDCNFLHSKVQKYMEVFSEETIIPKKNTEKLQLNRNDISAEEQFQILLRFNGVNAPSTFISKKVFEIVGNFNECFKMWEDRPMWLAITNGGIRLDFMDTITVNYRVHMDSATFYRRPNTIFTDSQIQKEMFLLKYSRNFGLIERVLKWINFKRKILFQKIGLNNSSNFAKRLNLLTGFILDYSIARINEKYK